MKLFKLFLLQVLPGLVIPTSCSEEDIRNTLSTNPSTVSFSPNGGSLNITIRTDADSWVIENPVSEWLELSATQGNGKSATVTLEVETRTLETRTGTLVVRAGNADPVNIKVTQVASDFLFDLSADATTLIFNKGGQTQVLTLTIDAPTWSLTSEADWLEFSKTSGTHGNAAINITAVPNASDDARSTTVVISASNAESLEVTITQKGALYPSYNTSPLPPDATGMTSTAVTIAAQITLGWNIGNSLEATGSETAWGNPKVTKELIDLVKANGFNAIRIPCSWNQYMENSATAKLKAEWMNRVKEVVQYCTDNDLHVVLNIHWDGGWLENNCTPEKQEENNAKQKAFWEQIATHLRDFDEHLIFASANEPNVDNATQMEVLTSYHQTFIDAVRSTGGRNSYRTLVVQGPSTDIDKTNDLMTSLPTDVAEDRMMVEIHYYTPYQFCLMTEDAQWGKMFYYWGDGYHSATDPTRNSTWGEEEDLINLFQKMKTKFVDQGIPVLLGEYAAIRRTSLTGDNLTKHLESRAYFLKFATQQALAHGLLPFYWDAGGLGNHGSGIFDRQNNTVFDQQALDALLEGAGN